MSDSDSDCVVIENVAAPEEGAVGRQWTCSQCTLINTKPLARVCEVCAAPREDYPSVPSQTKIRSPAVSPVISSSAALKAASRREARAAAAESTSSDDDDYDGFRECVKIASQLAETLRTRLLLCRLCGAWYSTEGVMAVHIMKTHRNGARDDFFNAFLSRSRIVTKDLPGRASGESLRELEALANRRREDGTHARAVEVANSESAKTKVNVHS